jgi:hypothetical protein
VYGISGIAISDIAGAAGAAWTPLAARAIDAAMMVRRMDMGISWMEVGCIHSIAF